MLGENSDKHTKVILKHMYNQYNKHTFNRDAIVLNEKKKKKKYSY